MAKKTIALIIVLFLLTATLLYAALSLQKQTPKQPIPPPPTQIVVKEEHIANTILLLSPNSLFIASSSGSLDVTIDTGENNVTAVQLELFFDPTRITNISITPATFFKHPTILLNTIDLKNGKISYAIAASTTDKVQKGSGIVATLSFTTSLKLGEKTEISFLPKSLVTAEGAQTSVLKTATGAAIYYTKKTK